MGGSTCEPRENERSAVDTARVTQTGPALLTYPTPRSSPLSRHSPVSNREGVLKAPAPQGTRAADIPCPLARSLYRLPSREFVHALGRVVPQRKPDLKRTAPPENYRGFTCWDRAASGEGRNTKSVIPGGLPLVSGELAVNNTRHPGARKKAIDPVPLIESTLLTRC